MDATSNQQLSSVAYWNQRYKADSNETPSSHEWFRSFEKLRPFLSSQLPSPDSNPQILHLGCGDSTLPADLSNLNYTKQICIDFSEVVITQMREKHPNLDWRVEDVRDLKLDDASFDIAIDKGTLDAMIYGSQWDPPQEVRDNVGKYVDEVARVLKPGGKWLYVTFRQPHFVKPQLLREGVWQVEVQRLEDGPGTFEYFAYVMTKSL